VFATRVPSITTHYSSIERAHVCTLKKT